MKRSLFATLFAAVFSVAAVANISTASGSTNEVSNIEAQCGVNCTEIVKAGPKYMVIKVDQHGDIFSVEPLDMPADATHVTSSDDTYNVQSEIVIVTIYKYYDAESNLVDVQKDETRFPLSSEK